MFRLGLCVLIAGIFLSCFFNAGRETIHVCALRRVFRVWCIALWWQQLSNTDQRDAWCVFDMLHLLHLPHHFPTLCAGVLNMWFLSLFLKSAMCEIVFYDHFDPMLCSTNLHLASLFQWYLYPSTDSTLLSLTLKNKTLFSKDKKQWVIQVEVDGSFSSQDQVSDTHMGCESSGSRQSKSCTATFFHMDTNNCPAVSLWHCIVPGCMRNS